MLIRSFHNQKLGVLKRKTDAVHEIKVLIENLSFKSFQLDILKIETGARFDSPFSFEFAKLAADGHLAENCFHFLSERADFVALQSLSSILSAF